MVKLFINQCATCQTCHGKPQDIATIYLTRDKSHLELDVGRSAWAVQKKPNKKIENSHQILDPCALRLMTGALNAEILESSTLNFAAKFNEFAAKISPLIFNEFATNF